MATEQRSQILKVYELPTVPNICNQILREVIKLPKVSMAHVIMNQGNVSLLHKHHKVREVYYILSGNGILYCGDNSYNVEKGTYLPIPINTTHKLRNTGNKDLEHLVFAIPPFNPDDVHLTEEKEDEEFSPEELARDTTLFEALDGAKVHELGSKNEREETGVGFAAGFLQPNRKAVPHYHEISDEVYYVVSGNGKVRLNEEVSDISKGSVIYIPTKTIHALENTSDSEQLEILCLSSPCYTKGDFVFK